jgi:hypothetical protein
MADRQPVFEGQTEFGNGEDDEEHEREHDSGFDEGGTLVVPSTETGTGASNATRQRLTFPGIYPHTWLFSWQFVPPMRPLPRRLYYP